MKALTLGLRVLLSGIFLYAGAAKVIDPVSFLESLHALVPINGSLLVFLALFLPALEIVLGFALWMPGSTLVAAAGTSLLILIFAGVSAYLVMTQQDLSCPCFGENSLFNLPPEGALVRNIALAVASTLIFVREIHHQTKRSF